MWAGRSMWVTFETPPGMVRAACSGGCWDTEAVGGEELFGERVCGWDLVKAGGLSWLVARWLQPMFPPAPSKLMYLQMAEASYPCVQAAEWFTLQGGCVLPMPGPTLTPPAGASSGCTACWLRVGFHPILGHWSWGGFSLCLWQVEAHASLYPELEVWLGGVYVTHVLSGLADWAEAGELEGWGVASVYPHRVISQALQLTWGHLGTVQTERLLPTQGGRPALGPAQQCQLCSWPPPPTTTAGLPKHRKEEKGV